MSIPYYVVTTQVCEYCEGHIYIGYEALLHNDGIFCDKDCLKEHLYEGSGSTEIYLTNDEIYRSVD